MRDIIFRGKRIDNGKWYYGSYLFLHVPEHDWTGTSRGPAKDVHFIVDQEDVNYAIYPDTLGQYTGMTDKNGEKIFEGDIIAFTNNDGCKSLYLVNWRASRWVIRYLPNVPCFDEMEDWNPKYWEVIGNKWDNPELLEATP